MSGTVIPFPVVPRPAPAGVAADFRAVPARFRLGERVWIRAGGQSGVVTQILELRRATLIFVMRIGGPETGTLLCRAEALARYAPSARPAAPPPALPARPVAGEIEDGA